MALFNKSESPRDRAQAASRAAAENSISIIGQGMRIEGDLHTDGTVRIEGTVQGTVRAGKAVVIGREGEVVGDVVTEDAVVGGTVRGTITAWSRLEVQSTSVIEGEIRTRADHMKLDEGARFNGRIEMTESAGGKPLPEPAGGDIPNADAPYPHAPEGS